jgi:hypothetical protein
MRSALFALPAFVALAMAADVSVTWRHELSTGSTSLTIQSADKTVLAETCGSSIGSLDFSLVDEHQNLQWRYCGRRVYWYRI